MARVYGVQGTPVPSEGGGGSREELESELRNSQATTGANQPTISTNMLPLPSLLFKI